MATSSINSNTASPRPIPSPAASASSFLSQQSSQIDAKLGSPPVGSPPDGISDASPPEGGGTLKKAGFTSKLSRMFTTRDAGPEKDRKDTAALRPSESSTSSVNGTYAVSPDRLVSNAGVSKRSPVPVDRKLSTSEALGNGASSEKDKLGHVSKRFTLLEDGTHEHLLKNDKRQEKLSNMFRNIIGLKKEGQHEDHQLSLMSSWVDQVKNEKDKLAADQKGGPNCANTLVEKYGKCQEVVGRGAFGIVRISHKADTKDPRKEQLYAVKEFRRRPQESPKKYNKRLTSEFCISSALRHPNVIHTLDLMKDAKGDFCEVMEYCAGGDLYTLVLAAGKLEVLEADCYFKQLMRGVEYIHEMGVAHRDLKPENLLLTTYGCLKVSDFGNGECFRMAWEQEAHMVAGLCGSAPYIAPEEYVDAEFDPRAVDVWACGVIYMAMRTGRHLWRVAKKDEDEFYDRYLEGRKDEDGYGPIEVLHRARCRNVIYSVLDPNPSRRITASQVLKSEWGREIKLCKAAEEGL